MGFLEYILVNYRWVFAVCFLMPLSLLYDTFYYLRSYVVFKLSSAPEKHDERVKYVQKQVRTWIAEGRSKQMCTARPGWQTISFRRPLYKNTLFNVQVNMMDVLDIDVDNRIVKVEPLVTIGQLTATLIPLGWTLPVVPELDDLTIGGMINGCGIETSSHKYGLFQHICVSYEVVLADGSFIKCNKENNTDLFYSIPWSHGTLGFLVAAELKIIPVKSYIRLSYHPAQTAKDIVTIFQDKSSCKEHDFVEGLVYSEHEAVVMTGTYTDAIPNDGKLNSIGCWHKPWFFKHVQGFLKDGSHEEYIPVRHYYHRHTRAIFWQLENIIPFGNAQWFRWLFGWMVPPKVSLLKLTQGQTIKELYEKHQLIQDMLLPINQLSEALTFFHQQLNIYPLWLCPFLLRADPGMVHPVSGKDELYVDIGAYGAPKVKNYQARDSTRRLEAFVSKSKGFQMLYADSYLTKEEFEQMFDHTLYDKMRTELDCDSAFPRVYDKVKKTART